MSQPLLTDILRSVSRAFYLTIRVLPAGLREVVGLAYLLARAADTVADTAALGPAQRGPELARLKARLAHPGSEYRVAAVRPADPAEGALLEALPDAFALYDQLPRRDRLAVRRVVETLISGMEFDLERFEADRLSALADESDLERYIYLVAGCVGEFWTVVSRRHTGALASWDPEVMEPLGIRFGKALQLTNVLRDLPRDLRNGRCYLPLDELAGRGLVPSDLLLPGNSRRAAPVLSKWLSRASHYYGDAVAYLLAIPPRCLRLRLATLWPVLIGLATLTRLAARPDWLEPGRVVKVSRRWVYAMLLWSLPLALCNPLLRIATRGMLSRLNLQNAALEEST